MIRDSRDLPKPNDELKLTDGERGVDIHFGWLSPLSHMRGIDSTQRPMIWLCNRHMDVSGEIFGEDELEAIEDWCREARKYIAAYREVRRTA